MKKTMYGLDASKYPTRLGQPWTDEETMKLLRAVQKKKVIADIAEEHERTVGGIISYLKKLAVDYHFNDNRPVEEIHKFTGLSVEVIKDAIRKKEFKDRVSSGTHVVGPTPSPEPTKIETARENVRQMKEDIAEIRGKVDKILELMTAVYEFEKGE
jgi:hypothetical protein